MVLSDITLTELKDCISPFEPSLVKNGNISYGVSSYGYDARLGNSFQLCSPPKNSNDDRIIDPKSLDQAIFTKHSGAHIIIPPHSFMLGHTVEYFKIPKDVIVICLGKSTYARCGIIVNVTPLEPGWEGQVTLELSNTTPYPAKVYANEGVCQFLFLRGDKPCKTSYADRSGKYMNQKGIVHARHYHQDKDK